jgi:hypothetical protein
MADPLRREAAKERLRAALYLLLLVIPLAAVAFYAAWSTTGSPKQINAVVVRIATYADYTGDLPVVTVRLENGSVRQFPTSWAAVSHCKPGSKISLVETQNRLRIGLPGCKANELTLRAER